MKILCHLVHPAHFHLFNNILKQLNANGHESLITIRNKDVLEKLLQESSIRYYKISEIENPSNKLRLIFGVLRKAYSLIKISRIFNPDIMISSATEVAIAGKILKIPTILFFEDDLEYVKKWAIIAGPLASVLMCPESCSAGRWANKAVKYNGYHELTYLHPKYIDGAINKSIETKRKFLLRLAKLTAYHDTNNTGIDNAVAHKIINKLKAKGEVYISAERELPNEIKELKLKIKPSNILKFMSEVDLFVGDSQTMAAEAAVLGVPSLRFNNFVGKLGYLEELERKYGLTYGIKTSESEILLEKIDELLNIPNIKAEWQKRRMKMFSEKIDVTAFMVWFIENYPNSVKVMKENPGFQYNFRF